MPVRDWAKLRQIPARMIWAQARRSLPTIDADSRRIAGVKTMCGGRSAVNAVAESGDNTSPAPGVRAPTL